MDQALQHPWITRNLEGVIPRTILEENIFRFEIEEKIRKVVNLSAFLSVVKYSEQVKEVLRLQ